MYRRPTAKQQPPFNVRPGLVQGCAAIGAGGSSVESRGSPR